MNPLTLFRRPEYFHRPSQAFRRLVRVFRRPADLEMVRLPWGRMVRVRTTETIGAGIYWYGIFDLHVCEAITRLLDPGELAMDVGANLGQMSSLMRAKVGASGRVIAFEPHPELFAELRANMEPLNGDASWAPVELHAVALGDHDGEGILDAGPHWATNRGNSRIVAAGAPVMSAVRVPLARLDFFVPHGASVGLCKIDVEGWEAAVLSGAGDLLAKHRIRDVVFEDFAPSPSPVLSLLEASGYQVYRLRRGSHSPQLSPAHEPFPEDCKDPERDFIATRDPSRLIERFQARGWRVLKGL